MVHFEVTGPGKIIGVDNGSNTIDEGFKTDQRTISYGMCLAIVQTTRSAGPIHITAHANGYKDVSADISAMQAK
jgi:beta-galactosidase